MQRAFTQWPIDDTRIQEIKELLPPAHVLREFPANERTAQTTFKARQEIHRCRQEIASLREHTRAADKDSQASMQALVNVLETILERDNPRPIPAGKEKDATKPVKEKNH